MVLKRAEVRNLKSYYPEELIDFNDKINLFIGPNGGGKSNLFEIIQGAVNNLLFKHVSLKPNGNRRSLDHPHKNKAYVIEYDNIDLTNLSLNVFDRHFQHLSDPASLYLIFKITSHDIQTITNVVQHKKQIASILNRTVAGSDELVEILNRIPSDVNFEIFIDQEIRLGVFPHESLKLQITDYIAFPPEQHPTLNLFFEIVQYLNVLHEISMLFPEVDVSPLSRYFGPHRTISQPTSNVPVNLSTLGSFEDNYSKGINVTKESALSNINGSYIKLCQLNELNRHSTIETYKKYLKKYLKIEIDIKKLYEMKFVCEYEIEYKRVSGVPMKLSSGEKEFFNLISGLILSGIRNGVVLLDEPELHLHAQWQQVILDLIYELTEEFNIQFFIVTHSSKFVNQRTLNNLYRVSMTDLCSTVTKPSEPTRSSEMKDLVQFLNSTNNEKIFFTHKVILVEGMSDQIIFDQIIKLLKDKTNSDTEIEILQVGSKHNLYKFRKLLNEWNIENYIIADIDYIREIRKNATSVIETASLRQLIIDSSNEITSILKFTDSKLKEILCKKTNLDNKSLVELISSKSALLKEEFLQKFDDITDYLIAERATSIDRSIPLSTKILNIFNKLAQKEKILVLEKGEIEDYYSVASNKIENALEVAKTINIRTLDPKIKSFLKKLLKN